MADSNAKEWGSHVVAVGVENRWVPESLHHLPQPRGLVFGRCSRNRQNVNLTSFLPLPATSPSFLISLARICDYEVEVSLPSLAIHHSCIRAMLFAAFGKVWGLFIRKLSQSTNDK
jgi:hypothetical protein